jgi:heterodisulfide reductase subunit B
MPELGVELVNMKGENCCAPFSVQSVDYASWMALAARNLCIAEEMGLDIMTLCNDCYESLLMMNTLLKRSPELKDKVNGILSEIGKEYKGKVGVKNLVDVLYGDVGIQKVKSVIKEPFNGLKVGAANLFLMNAKKCAAEVRFATLTTTSPDKCQDKNS